MKSMPDGRQKYMTKEDIELGMKCCNEFFCGECPYEKYNSPEYPLRCIPNLMQDINKLYFEEKEKQQQITTNK